MRNADKIRAMTDEELAEYIPCPYDTAGTEIMPCILDKTESGDPEFISPGKCKQCTLEWLKKEVNE